MTPSPLAPDAEATRAAAQARARLLDLAYDISLRLRQHAQPAVRISAALLLAASLASCDGDPSDAADGDAAPQVEPLREEVRRGLPAQAGRYPLVENSLRRDEQGVYHFAWRQPGQTSGPGTPASASLVRLAPADAEAVEIPPSGDPVLHLRSNSQIQLASAVDAATPVPGSGRTTSTSYVYWRPFYLGAPLSGPAYYDPPSRSAPTYSVVDGARGSTAPTAPAERTFGLAHAVSGRAGGTGSGTAASARAGVDLGATGGKSGVTAPRSSAFSGGGGAAASSGGSSS